MDGLLLPPAEAKKAGEGIGEDPETPVGYELDELL